MRAICTLLLLAAWQTPAQVHKTPMAGRWFPAEGPALEKALDEAFGTARKRTGSVPPRKMLRALIAPHAGLAYSGTVAAAAYGLLDHPRNVILLGFSHSRRIQGVVAPVLDAYSTPLGDVKLNRAALRELNFRTAPEEEVCDHSLENQLPFLQRAAPGAALIPLYVGELSEEALATAALKLRARLAKGDVLIASSDFTHYGESYQYTPFPNDKELPRRLLRRAIGAFEQIGSLDVAGFDRFLSATGDNLCGRNPIRLLMAALTRHQEETYLSAIDYMASGDLTKDYSVSVSYGALAFYPSSAFSVMEEDQKKLLASARRTLDGFLASGKKGNVPVPADERGPDLEQHTGIFVTVKKNGQLRGCIGSLFPPQPLWGAVADRTLAAASEDPRFQPVTAQEGPLSLEISLLTPLKRIQDWRQFRLGQGAVIVLGAKTGLLLPQIAEENRWNREQFLENLARKAGLDPNAYRDPQVTLYVYSGQVFAERSALARATGGSDQ